MEAKHTPGPWSVHRVEAAEHVKTLTGSHHYGREYVAVVAAGGTVICDNAGYYPEELDPRNAPLIAAAPELLDVLNGILKCKRGMLGHLFLEGWQEEVVRAAISKATGTSACTNL